MTSFYDAFISVSLESHTLAVVAVMRVRVGTTYHQSTQSRQSPLTPQ